MALFVFSANFVCDASHLMSGVRRMRFKSITSQDDVVNTTPSKWPGEIIKKYLVKNCQFCNQIYSWKKKCNKIEILKLFLDWWLFLWNIGEK